ncbi:MAG: DNA primase [Ottowia sp.]|nr:DNA primase [Ottowia sp.]
MGKYIRFSETLLEQMRSNINLPELIARDMTLKKMGNNFVAKCPFHEEKTASFNVSSNKNTYRCYSCGAYGDAIAWLRHKHHLSFYESVIRLAGIFGVPLPAEEESSPENKIERQHLANLYQTLKAAHKIYRHGLLKSQLARDYLEKTRGLTQATIAQFELGVVASGVLPFLDKVDRADLIASGLAIESDNGTLYDRFRHRIMFPIHNERGNVIGMAGRILTTQQDKFPKYINSPETAIFHKGQELYALHLAKQAIRESGIAVIVEGYLDVMSLHQAGDQRAVAPMGTSITQRQVNRIFAYADTLVFALDGDKAGRKAILTMLPVLLGEMNDKKTAKVLLLPEDEDPDSFVRKQGINAWLSVVENATPLSIVLVDYVRDGTDLGLPEGQVAAAEKAKEVLTWIKKAGLFKLALQRKFEEVIGFPLD